MKRILFVVAALVLAAGSAASAAGGTSGTISGTVVDASGSGVSGADVTLRAPTGRYVAHTDGRGTFKIINVAIDTYTVVVHKDGFADQTLTGVEPIGDQSEDLGSITLRKR